MRKVFTDELQRQLPQMFIDQFPDFVRYRPKQSAEEKERFPLPIGTDYFRRVRGSIWEIIGVRRYSQDEWTLEIFWSAYSRFPSSRLNLDYGVKIDDLIKQAEAHTCSRDVIPTGYPTDWPVWTCSVPFNHPEYLTRYSAEMLQPIDSDFAKRKVAEQLQSTADMIKEFVLPLFTEVERYAAAHPVQTGSPR